MCCSTTCAKILLVIFNIGFVLLGVALLAVGILIITDTSVLSSVLVQVPTVGQTLDEALQTTSLLSTAAYVIIGVGAVSFIIGFSGCCGALKEIKCLLVIYAIIVIAILLVQITAGILGAVFRTRATSYMQTFLASTIAQKYVGLNITNGVLTESIEPYSAAWDTAMITLECCGNYNYSDFADSAVNWNRSYTYGAYSLTNVLVPISCCKTTSKTALLTDMANFNNYFVNSTQCLTTADPTYTNTVNCHDKIVSYVNTYTWAVLGVIIGIVIMELLAIISACALIKNIGKDEFV